MNVVKAPYTGNKTDAVSGRGGLSSGLTPSVSCCEIHWGGSDRGAARLLTVRVHGLSLGRQLFAERLKQHDKAAALHEAGRERGGGPYRGDQANDLGASA